MLPHYLPPVLKCWVKPPFYFLLLMAFLGAALVSFGFLLFQVFTPRGSQELPPLQAAQTCHSSDFTLRSSLGHSFALCTSKTWKSNEGIKGKCREGRETDPFYSRGFDPSTGFGHRFSTLGSHSHMKSILMITLGVNPSLFLQCSCMGEFGHCEPSPSVSRVTI